MTILDTTPRTPALPDLRGLTSDQLAAAWNAADVDDPAVLAAFLAEFGQRTAAEKTARAAERRERAERQLHDDWYDQLHAQRTAFEAEGIGYVLNAEGTRLGVSEWALWTGRASAELHGTREFRDFIKRWPLLTLAAYKRQRHAAGRIQRQEWRDRDEITDTKGTTDERDTSGPGLADTEAGALRRGTAAPQAPQAGTGGTVQRGRRSPGTGTEGSEDRAADGRASRPVRRDELKGAGDMGVIGAAAGAVKTVDREREAARQARDARQARTQGGTVAVTRPAAAVRRDEQRIPGDQLLDLLRDGWFGHYARFPSPAALDAVTLWAAHAHMRDETGVLVSRATPRLFLLSSGPGSGKSHVLEMIGRVTPAWYGLDLEPTAAGLTYTISREHATVTLDEADVMFGAGSRHEAVRAIINGGTYRHGTVLNGKGAKVNRVPVFGALALAGLDTMEKDTGDKLAPLLSRGVKIRMAKASGEDRPPRLTAHAEESAGKAKTWLERWAAQVRDEVAGAEPEVPEGVEGRAEDIWIPLLAVAEAAGRDAAARRAAAGIPEDEVDPATDWPHRARAACRELALGKPDGGENLEEDFAAFAGSFGGL